MPVIFLAGRYEQPSIDQSFKGFICLNINSSIIPQFIKTTFATFVMLVIHKIIKRKKIIKKKDAKRFFVCLSETARLS